MDGYDPNYSKNVPLLSKSGRREAEKSVGKLEIPFPITNSSKPNCYLSCVNGWWREVRILGQTFGNGLTALP